MNCMAPGAIVSYTPKLGRRNTRFSTDGPNPADAGGLTSQNTMTLGYVLTRAQGSLRHWLPPSPKNQLNPTANNKTLQRWRDLSFVFRMAGVSDHDAGVSLL